MLQAADSSEGISFLVESCVVTSLSQSLPSGREPVTLRLPDLGQWELFSPLRVSHRNHLTDKPSHSQFVFSYLFLYTHNNMFHYQSLPPPSSDYWGRRLLQLPDVCITAPECSLMCLAYWSTCTDSTPTGPAVHSPQVEAFSRARGAFAVAGFGQRWQNHSAETAGGRRHQPHHTDTSTYVLHSHHWHVRYLSVSSNLLMLR